MHKDTITGRPFPNALLEPYRRVGDPMADSVNDTVGLQGGHRAIGQLINSLNEDSLVTPLHLPNVVKCFIDEQRTVHYPINTPLLKEGIRFFWQHYQHIALLLGVYSLPYCYAGANGARILWMTERMKNNTLQRLEETGAFVFGIMQEHDWDNGNALERIARIRLLHAAVRWMVLHSNQWDSTGGYPICQEDMAGTNLSFSYIVLKGIRRMGFRPTMHEEHAYLYVWKIVGLAMGIDPQLLPENTLEAYRLDKAIAARQFKASEAGQGLTRALLYSMQEGISSPTLQNLPSAQMRYFLGNSLADLLGIPDTPWEDQFLNLAYSLPIIPRWVGLPSPAEGSLLRKYWR
jgi:hypothetical protein